MVKRKAPPKAPEAAADPTITEAMVMDDLLTVLLTASDRRHPDPAIAEAMRRLDNKRRLLHKDVGSKPTDIPDPHGYLTGAGQTEGDDS